jgi:hypothetical protein
MQAKPIMNKSEQVIGIRPAANAAAFDTETRSALSAAGLVIRQPRFPYTTESAWPSAPDQDLTKLLKQLLKQFS